MVLVKTHSHYNLPLEIDQCTTCGGVWFDTAELFTSHHKAHEDLPVLDVKLLSKDRTTEAERLICPRDQRDLLRMTDSNLPEELLLESCSVCHGFFLNRTHFASYQDFRTSERPEIGFEDKQLEAKLQVLLENQSDIELQKSLQKMSKILMKPVPVRVFAAYALFGMSGYIVTGLSVLLRELWMGVANSQFTYNSKQKKEDKLKAIAKFILNPK